jgi:hypothetical protein
VWQQQHAEGIFCPTKAVELTAAEQQQEHLAACAGAQTAVGAAQHSMRCSNALLMLCFSCSSAMVTVQHCLPP